MYNQTHSELITEIERLRAANLRLTSMTQELRLEISYYQGEAKKVEWEKEVLKQEVKNMSGLFKAWMNETKVNRFNRIFEDPNLITLMADFPTQPISNIVVTNCNVPILLTTCQEPFFIEYVNNKWSDVCGWESHEICGYPCKFLQGEFTDKSVIKSFMDDIREIGYARMRVVNYRKDGSSYMATVTVFPVYDTVCPDGLGSSNPILTHFGTTISDLVESTSSVEDTKKQIKSNTKYADPRFNCIKFNAPCQINQKNFIRLSTTVRLSDLLRFSLSCESPILIMDAGGHVVHSNNSWFELYGFPLSEIQGKEGFDIMTHGGAFDYTEILSTGLPYQISCLNYKRDGTSFYSHITTMPIKGGLTNDPTHLCILSVPLSGCPNN